MDHILISNEGLDYSDAPPKIERNTKYNCQRQTPTAEIVGKSKNLLLALDQIRRFSDLSECVLIEGETGTGKELAARQLHQQGRWKSGPFVAINCAAIQSSLVQAELFGHEMGAFTDAKRTRPGLVSEAEGGSLFLDEINSLSMECQGALLRFLDDRTYRRLGSDQLRRSRVRIIAATNSDLTAKMKNGVFREDLWYRLKKLTLRLPPLRDRRDDIESLAHYFMEKHIRNEPFLNLRKFDENLLSWMKHYSWPGNVRELENVVFQWLVGWAGRFVVCIEGVAFGTKPFSKSFF